MKEDILIELKAPKSRLRVVFATTALGMGVDAQILKTSFIYLPPANLESYAQEKEELVGVAASHMQHYIILTLIFLAKFLKIQ